MNSEDVCKLFPEIAEISSKELQVLTIKALIMGIEQGGWDKTTISLVPVTVNWQCCSSNLLEHIRTVTQVCISNFDVLNKYYINNGVPFQRDIVVTGALLHDLGKFTEFSLENNKPVHSKTAYLMRHPLSGAIIAAKAGLPDEIVHLIATHSFEGDKSNQTAESDFIRQIDIFVFKCSVYGLKKS